MLQYESIITARNMGCILFSCGEAQGCYGAVATPGSQRICRSSHGGTILKKDYETRELGCQALLEERGHGFTADRLELCEGTEGQVAGQ